MLLCTTAASVALLAGCDDDGGDNDGDATSDATSTMGDTTMTTGTDATTSTATDMTTSTGTDATTTTSTDATMTTGNDTVDPDMCPTEAECAANGQVLDAGPPCMCVDAPAGTCTSAGDMCDATVAQPAGFRCIDDNGDGTSTCFEYCGDDGQCDTGELCAGDMGDEVCLPSTCNGFFDNNCPAGEKCIPNVNQSAFCVAQGAGMEGDACMNLGECGADLLCVNGTCDAYDCAPITNNPGCASGETCFGLSFGDDPLDVGECIETCDPFTGSDTCGPAGDGQFCFPLDERDGTEIPGLCQDDPGGMAAKGAACDAMNACITPDGGGAAPLICVGDCQQLCDPEAATTTCETGEECFPTNLVLGSQQTCSSDADCAVVGPDAFCNGGTCAEPYNPAWGLCGVNCTPFVDPSMNGCPDMGDICIPDFETPGLGQCSAPGSGTVPDGGDCTADASVCEDGTICLGQGDGTAQCSFICDPEAMDGAPGSCPDSASGSFQSCLPLVTQNPDGTTSPLAIGSCSETCDLSDLANKGCAPDADGNARACLQGFWFGIDLGDPNLGLCQALGDDTPLMEREPCTAEVDMNGDEIPGTGNGYIESEICDDGALCFLIPGETQDENGVDEVQCVKTCIDPTIQGAHPQCGDTLTFCSGGFQDPALGICTIDSTGG